MNNKVRPALIGGVLVGLLTIIPVVNSCCCLFAILGGMLASYLYVKKSPVPVTPGEGAFVGVLTGGIGALIFLVLGIPITYVTNPMIREWAMGILENANSTQAEMFRRQMQAESDSIASIIITSLIFAVLLFIFSVIGGLIGTALFEKRKGNATTPPPPPPMAGGPGAFAP